MKMKTSLAKIGSPAKKRKAGGVQIKLEAAVRKATRSTVKDCDAIDCCSDSDDRDS